MNKVASPSCPFCPSDSQNIHHLFISCPQASSFWYEFQSWYSTISNVTLLLADPEVLIGITRPCTHRLTLNHLIMLSKYFPCINALNRGYYTVARRYEFYVLVARTISHEWASLTREILFLPREHKIHIFEPTCNVLLLYGETNSTKAKGGNRAVIERYDTHKRDIRKIRHSGPGWSGVWNLRVVKFPVKHSSPYNKTGYRVENCWFFQLELTGYLGQKLTWSGILRPPNGASQIVSHIMLRKVKGK